MLGVYRHIFPERLLKGINLTVAEWVDHSKISSNNSKVGLYDLLFKNTKREKGFDDALMLDYRGY